MIVNTSITVSEQQFGCFCSQERIGTFMYVSLQGERGEKADPPLPHYEEADSEDSNYWAPASDKDKLILQLSRLRVPPISEQDLW